MEKQKIGLLSATALGVSSIIGSGWLFAPFRAAVIAGPASLISWIIGAVLAALLALCFAEIAALYPRQGLTAIIPTLSHNKYFGFPFAIANWLGIVAVIGLEADATIQYLINLAPQLLELFYVNDRLTVLGNSCSVALVMVFALLNYWGAVTLTRANNLMAVLKVLVPIIVALIIISVAFHPRNFVAVNRSFLPYGVSSIFTAVINSGIIIAFNGFQTIVSFAGEIKKPEKTISQALLISIIFCLGIYLLLSVGFIGAIPEAQLGQGWKELKFAAPMIELALLLGLASLTSIIYFGATIAPSGTGIAFTGASTRMFSAMARHAQMPKFFEKLHPVYGISRPSLVINTLLAIGFVLMFRSWGELAKFLSLLHIIAYLPIPLALWVFRDFMGKQPYAFKVKGGRAIAGFLFVFFTYLITMGDVDIIEVVLILLAILQGFFVVFSVKSFAQLKKAFKQSSMLMLYFIGLLFFTYISPTHASYISNEWFMLALLIFSLLSFFALVRFERNDENIIFSAVTIYEEDGEGMSK